MSTAFLYDERFLEHNTGPEHPERPERLKAVMERLLPLDWFSKLHQVPVSPANVGSILEVHSLNYVQHVESLCKENASYVDTPDVGVCDKSYDIALLAAGGALALADTVVSGKSQNAFGLLRPPGHHAERTQAMGFCLFNNIAITARYLQIKHQLEKILILDWDVHHGNGTQHIFEEDPSVFYISLHQYPFYPGTGSKDETGIGKGKGATLNCPMATGYTDHHYHDAFEQQIIPKANAFKPDCVLISAGFDAHAKDPLAAMNLTADCFTWMTTRLMEIADKHCGGKIISLLEGGYDLMALPICVENHLQTLAVVKN